MYQLITIKRKSILSYQWVHGDIKEVAVYIINKTLKVKVEQQQQYQNESVLTPSNHEDIKEVLDIIVESEMNGVNILYSLNLENESSSNDMEYLSDFTAESFASIEV